MLNVKPKTKKENINSKSIFFLRNFIVILRDELPIERRDDGGIKK